MDDNVEADRSFRVSPYDMRSAANASLVGAKTV